MLEPQSITATPKKSGRLATTWQLMRESWRVLMADKELLVFPILSTLAISVVIGSFVIPFFALSGVAGRLEQAADLADTGVLYLGLLLLYIVLYFIANFFNAALVGAAYIRLTGGNPTIGAGLRQATQRVGKIFLWSVVAATVGLILRAIEERSGTVGKIVAAVLGIAWSLLTYFAIPVIVFENLSLKQTITRSAGLFKQTWGENVISQISIGSIFVLLMLLGAAVPVAAMVAGFNLGVGVAMIALIIYWVLLGIIRSTLGAILDTALYVYATTGTVPVAFSAELLQHAFAPKKGWLR